MLSLISRAFAVRRLLSIENARDIAEDLGRLKREAIDGMIHPGPVDGPDPDVLPSLWLRSGIIMLYEVSEREDAFTHHISLSLQGSALPVPVGQAVLVFTLSMLGISLEQTAIFHTSRGVHHAEFVLTEYGESLYEGTEVGGLSQPEVETLFRDCIQLRNTMIQDGRLSLAPVRIPTQQASC